MPDEKRENPLELPKVGKITKAQATNINLRGGESVNPADPSSPSFMVEDQNHPEKLPEQGKPSTSSNN